MDIDIDMDSIRDSIRDIDIYAKTYLDVVSRKKVLTDFDYRHKGPNMGHGFKEHVNGMIIEVEGKRSKHFRSYWGVSTDSDEIEKSFPYDLVDFWDLRVLKESSGREFDLSGHIRRYVKNVTEILIRRKPDLVKKIWDNLDAIIQFLSDKLDDLRIFSADPTDPKNAALVFQYISKPNTLLYLFFGLSGVMDVSHELLLGLDAPLDSMPDSEQERIRNEPRLTDVVFGPRKSELSQESLRLVNLIRFQIYQRSAAKAFGRPPPPSLDEKLLLIGGSNTGHKSPEMEVDKPLIGCSGTGHKSLELEVDKPLLSGGSDTGHERPELDKPSSPKRTKLI